MGMEWKLLYIRLWCTGKDKRKKLLTVEYLFGIQQRPINVPDCPQYFLDSYFSQQKTINTELEYTNFGGSISYA